MGRLENPVDHSVPYRGMLADLLRGERRRAGGPSYEQMAARSGVSAATLKRAASGKHTPSTKTISSYLSACQSEGRTFVKAYILQVKSRRDERGGHGRVFVDGINTSAALLDALTTLYVNQGVPTYREMQSHAGGKHMLPISSISRILNRKMLPVDEHQMAAFLQGCFVFPRDQEKWLQAWRRVKGSAPTSHYTPRAVVEQVTRMLREEDPKKAAIHRRPARVVTLEAYQDLSRLAHHEGVAAAAAERPAA